jgi:hypothetical protein
MEDGWVSSCYGERAPAPVCKFSVSGTGAQEFYSFLLPRRAGAAEAEVLEMEASGGRAFEIRDQASCDVLLAGSGALIETERITSDFKWAWARFANDEETLEDLVLIDGRRFSLNGQEILMLPEPVGYAVARRVDDKLRIEIDDRILEVGLTVDELVTASSVFNPKSKI